jgi:glucose-1-phosphate cytidylyltransferase
VCFPQDLKIRREEITMKVVLFCGGLGMRLRANDEDIPKPMVHIGYRPLMWHVMKYYAHFGHKQFILCLGYRSDVIKNYFLNYSECLSNDFVLSNGGKSVQIYNSDIDDWKITFVETGPHSNIGQRLKAVERYLEGAEVFLANYSDNLTNFHLPTLIEHFQKSDKTAAMLCVKPNMSVHFVSVNGEGFVDDIRDIDQTGIRINGGYFVFKKRIFDYLQDGEELVHEPFQRLIAEGQLTGYPYDGFWKAMDTFKDKRQLDEMYSKGHAPWELWKIRFN